LNARAVEILWTGGATESNNLAIKGVADTHTRAVGQVECFNLLCASADDVPNPRVRHRCMANDLNQTFHELLKRVLCHVLFLNSAFLPRP
jgi:hypothetical protein